MISHLRTYVGTSSAVCVAAALLAAPLNAAPLKYQLHMTAGLESPSHPLAGATLQLNLSWDAAALPPEFSNTTSTSWSPSNTTGSLTVTGSASSDGTYDVFFFDTSLYWKTSNRSFGDFLEFPQLGFEINGMTVRTGWLQVQFANSFFTPPGPFMPKAFTNSEAIWGDLGFLVDEIDGALVFAKVASGSATQVPEPATLASGCFALLGLAALRRRK